MNVLLIFAVALLPVALLLWYIYKMDPQPEPTPLLAKAFFYGVLIVFPVVFVELAIEAVLGGIMSALPFIGATLKAFFVAAIPEESFKLLALWLLVRKNPYFDEHIDGIVYAVFVSLGFAALENIFYLFDNQEEFLQVGILRALLAVPGHYAFGILMGFFYSLYYFVNRSRRNKIMMIVAPVLAHGIYDNLLFWGEVSPILGGIGVLAVIFFCIKMHKFCYNRIQSHKHRDEKFFGSNYGEVSEA
jgi:RsiW-degrading membrane proteinase PrsW (M82 family)